MTCLGISAPPIELAARSLALFMDAVLAQRATELRSRAARFDKPGLSVNAAAGRLGILLASSGGDLPTRTAVCDVFDPATFDVPPVADMLITDIPYDPEATWQGRPPATGDTVAALPDSLRVMLPGHAVVAVWARTRKIILDCPVRLLKRAGVGHRAAVVVRVSDLGVRR